jgi:hypothetical protein
MGSVPLQDTKTFEPRLDVVRTLATITWLLEEHPDEFSNLDCARASWKCWARTHPLKVQDVACKPSWEWPEPCADYQKNLPDGLAVKSMTFVRRSLLPASK